MLNLSDSILPVQSPLTFESFEFKGDFSLKAPKHKPSMIPLPEDPHILGYNYSDGEFESEETKVFDFEPRTYREFKRRPLNLDFNDIFSLANLFPEIHVQQPDDDATQIHEETVPEPEESVSEPEETVPELEETV